MAFIELHRGGQFSPSAWGSVCSLDGLVAPEMLCIKPLLFHPQAASAAHAAAGAERDLQPLPRGVFTLHPARGCSETMVASDAAQ